MKKDFEIQKDVMEELKTIPLLNANEIGVAVKNGVVTLSGIVDSYPKKISVERAVRKIRGVRGIAEELEVHLSTENAKTDSEIAQAVIYALEWHSATQFDRIKIFVEEGFVTIEGTADWDYQRKHATKVAENVKGVRGVINNIKLMTKPLTSDIKDKISNAFIRNASIDANKIDIKTEGNKVVLTGKVKSWSEYEEAERSAWLAPGVTVIENDLEVEDDLEFEDDRV